MEWFQLYEAAVQCNNAVLWNYKVTDLQVVQTNKEWFAKGYPRAE